MTKDKKTYNYKSLDKATKAELQAWISEILAYLRPLAPNYEVSPETIEASARRPLWGSCLRGRNCS